MISALVEFDRERRHHHGSTGDPSRVQANLAAEQVRFNLDHAIAGVTEFQIRELRAALLRMIVEVSCADGEIANEERAAVKATASAFGFDASIADELIDWALASIKLDQRENEIMAKLL